jgi:hypothetical protein
LDANVSIESRRIDSGRPFLAQTKRWKRNGQHENTKPAHAEFLEKLNREAMAIETQPPEDIIISKTNACEQPALGDIRPRPECRLFRIPPVSAKYSHEGKRLLDIAVSSPTVDRLAAPRRAFTQLPLSESIGGVPFHRGFQTHGASRCAG